MKKVVYRNWDLLIAFAVLLALGLLNFGDLVAALIVDVPGFLLVLLGCRWLHAPQGVLTKTEYADGVATVTNVWRKRTQTVDLANAVHLYKVKKVLSFLVVSDEPLPDKKAAFMACKAGKAGFVILSGAVRGALYSYEKKAQTLK